MLAKWHTLRMAPDGFLEGLTTDMPQSDLLLSGKSVGPTLASIKRQVTYHYWYHIGEIQAIRRMLLNKDLPDCVGDIEIEAPFRPR